MLEFEEPLEMAAALFTGCTTRIHPGITDHQRPMQLKCVEVYIDVMIKQETYQGLHGVVI